MRLVEIVSLMDPEVTPQNTKIHLATWNGDEDPYDVYLAGSFDDWQRWQTKRNFERQFVIALIGLPGVNRWLYAGVHTSSGCEWRPDKNLFYYTLQERLSCSEFNGRLIANFARPSRQSYLIAENWLDRVLIGEIRPQRLGIEDFPGFKRVDLPKPKLDLVVAQGVESWRTALSSVAGVYLISDSASGKLYVGSACGEGGIWQRWCQYVASGHGGNVELRRLF